jgi:hypothetical protein
MDPGRQQVRLLATSPARGKIGGQQAVDGFRGTGLLNSFTGGDKSEGSLTSTAFEINRKHLSFLIGGGNHPNKTCVNLRVDGTVVRTATGDNAERLSWKSWNLSDLQGKKGILEVVDREQGGWGHINADHFVLADAPARPAQTPALWADWGRDFYAAVSWSDIPPRDGRRLWLGWMSNWEYANDVPTVPWRSAMSIPRELTLRSTATGLRLVQKPVRELASYRGKQHRYSGASLAKANQWLQKREFATPLLEVELEVQPRGTEGITLELATERNETVEVHCDPVRSSLILDRTRSGRIDFHDKFPGRYEAPLGLRDGKIKLNLVIDRSSLEVFGDEGLLMPHEPHASRRQDANVPLPRACRLLEESNNSESGSSRFPNCNAIVSFDPSRLARVGACPAQPRARTESNQSLGLYPTQSADAARPPTTQPKRQPYRRLYPGAAGDRGADPFPASKP